LPFGTRNDEPPQRYTEIEQFRCCELTWRRSGGTPIERAPAEVANELEFLAEFLIQAFDIPSDEGLLKSRSVLSDREQTRLLREYGLHNTATLSIDSPVVAAALSSLLKRVDGEMKKKLSQQLKQRYTPT
jgi:hypothetical protein